MNVLIFGGSGIISSEITSLLIKKGHEVTIINRGNRKGFINTKATLIISDLRKDPVEQIKKKLKNSYDAIIDVVSYSEKDLKKNMEIAKGICNQYIFFSTAVVYRTKTGRYNEDDEIGNEAWLYSIDKVKCEKLLEKESKGYGFVWTIIRPYITYGESRIPLQFGPLEYYTIINRAKHGKPIPVYDQEIKCTFTYSKDFAIGLVGLINNSSAFNQAFHITGQYETTWAKSLDSIMKAFQVEYSTVSINRNTFQNTRLMRGLDASEVLGDKSRDMLFNNDKIKKAVPSFLGNTSFESVLPEIAEFYRDKTHQKINYAWDARVDCMLSRIKGLTKKQLRSLRFAPGYDATKKDKWTYFWNRYELTFFFLRISKKIKSKLKRR